MTIIRISLILVSLGLAALSAQPTAPPSKSTVPTSTIEIDGVALRVRSSVTNGVAPPAPVVVFETGAGFGVETWDPILDKVAAFAPVVAYDRLVDGARAR